MEGGGTAKRDIIFLSIYKLVASIEETEIVGSNSQENGTATQKGENTETPVELVATSV